MPLAEFRRQLSEFIAYVKTSPPTGGSAGILHPGEAEYRTEQQRRRDGIEVEDETWTAIQAVAREYGVALG